MKRIYADLRKTDYKGRVLLTSFGTARDLSKHGIIFVEGKTFYFYNDDEDKKDVTVFEGIVQYDNSENRWVAKIDGENVMKLSQVSEEELNKF
jgi:hypothetical protein